MFRGVLTVVCLALCATNGLAQTTEGPITELKRRVEQLEKRVVALEERTATSPVGVGSKVAWRSLSKGMTQDDVRNILGEPSRVVAGSPFLVWFYGKGTVQFTVHNAQVFGWSEP